MEKSSVLTTNPNGIETLSVSSRNRSSINISTNTIISSIERDLKELQKELTVRNQKEQIGKETKKVKSIILNLIMFLNVYCSKVKKGVIHIQ